MQPVNRQYATLAAIFAVAAMTGTARACDGKSYSFPMTVGQSVNGGGLEVQLNKVKLLDNVPDKYTISVKDEADVLADHMILIQYDTLSFKTRCGTLSIGADRKSMFSHGTLALNWSYF
jgi:hypothetical protein